MKVTVNGKELETSASDLLQLSEELGLHTQGLAIAVNNRMIPRTSWKQQLLQECDSIIIIKAACGG